MRTQAGELTVSEEGEWLALLRYVPGVAVALDTPESLAVWGRAMGRIHSLLVDVTSPEGLPLAESRSPPEVPPVAGAEWVGPAITEATDAIQRLSGLTEGIYHGDGCEPRRDPATGEVSVIDWGTAGYGPLLIDVGTTCWYLQSDYQRKCEELAPFLEAYLAAAPIHSTELAHLDAFIRLRAAMSGWYFAWRIDQGYTAGADAEWNASGLAQARQLWESLGG